MADPQTANVGFYQPTRGSDPGLWDLPVNANSGALDSLFAATAAITLSNANVTLTTPPNSGATWSGPYQSQCALILLSGAITANLTVTVPRAGFFIFHNLCTSGTVGAGSTASSNSIALKAGGAGNVIGLPYGKKQFCYSDGSNMDFVNPPEPGTAYDLHGAIALPSWMTICTVRPYLIKDGTVYSNATYPALAGILGTVFGGSSGSTFGVPDERSRARLGYDPSNATARITSVIANSMGSAGGSQFMQSHNHGVSDPGHVHGYPGGGFLGSGGSGYGTAPAGASIPIFSSSVTTSSPTGLSVVAAGSGGSQNIQPSIVSFLPLIKT
jgi:microcystin-dependent protein